MKIWFFFAILFLSATTGFSQPTVASSHEFDLYQKAGGGGVAAFKTGYGSDADGSQFFLPDWQKGDVVLKNNTVFNNGLLLTYDKVRQELFIKQGESSEVLTGNKDDIETFSLHDGDKQYYFISSSRYSDTRPVVFYQILTGDSSKLTLLKYTKGTFVKADNSDLMKTRQGNVNDAFVDKITYYIAKENGLLEILVLKSKALKKAFANLNINIEKYLNEHPGSVDEDYLISMVAELNK
ncbi:MAG TPA: hypothetical protein VGH64_11745 [Puia sp.]|jgi:hypothetical protein